MIPITKIPVFLEFFKQFVKYTHIKIKFNFEKELSVDNCMCNDKECGIIYMKRVKPWKKILIGNDISFNTNQGLFVLKFYEDGYFTFEALCYDKFPYIKESKRVFSSMKELNTNKDQRSRFSKQTISYTDKQNLKRYFSKLRYVPLKIVIIDD